MSQALIRAALMTKLATWAAAHSPVITIAREGVPFTKPVDGGPFIEAIIIPANTTSPTTEATRKRYFGELAINVWTKESVGTGLGEGIVAEIEALFPVVPKTLLPISIEQTPSAKRAFIDGFGWRVIPICIMYRAEY